MESTRSPRKKTLHKESSWFLVLSPQGAARSIGEETIKAFSQRGVRHKVFDIAKFDTAFQHMLQQPDDALVVDLTNQSLIVQALDFGATHALVLALCPVTAFAVQLLKKQGVCTVHWFYEDFRRADYWRQVIAAYDHFAAVQRGPLLHACEGAGTQFHLLQTAATIPEKPPEPVEPSIDLCFIGIPSSYRARILETLLSAGRSLKIAGLGWQNYSGPLETSIVATDWVTPEQGRSILNTTRIGLNLSLRDPNDGREHVQISPRVYDILQARRHLLTENVPLATEALSDFHYSTFDGDSDVVEKTREALETYEQDFAKREANCAAVEQRHTFANRVDELLHYF